jgi:hypothetical protein
MAEVACADCGTRFVGNYCPHCGQEANIQSPTLRHFVRELVDQFVAVEGKLGRTLQMLVLQPGRLTQEYLLGRRQRYVRPFKLYVSISLIFFSLFAMLPDSFRPPVEIHPHKSASATEPAAAGQSITDDTDGDAEGEDDEADETAGASSASSAAPAGTTAIPTPAPTSEPVPGASVAAQSASPVAQGAEKTSPAIAHARAERQAHEALGAELAADLKKELGAELVKNSLQISATNDVKTAVPGAAQGFPGGQNADVGKNPKFFDFEHFADRLSQPTEQKALREKLADEAPYAMFFLVPYLALILRWFYRSRQRLYAEHLLFSLHLHTFGFIALILAFIPYKPVQSLVDWVIGIYLFLALRTFYGGGWGATLWRMVGLYGFYMAAIAATAFSGVLAFMFGGDS